ncbi:MAG TPA: rRNA maturation RNAse YbeY [Candidatus Nitrosocosmicus sp.]|nr:rRNA maturation RNAse YbeY [Candidatus Nitrosocosmicus sp.]
MVKIYTATRHKINKKYLLEETQKILTRNEIPGYLVNIIFVGKRKMRDIANTYKHEDEALPVLSFTYRNNSVDSVTPSFSPSSAKAMEGRQSSLSIEASAKLDEVVPPTEPNTEIRNENEHLLGEVFICYPQAILLAAEREKGVEQTILQLIEHGIDNLLK